MMRLLTRSTVTVALLFCGMLIGWFVPSVLFAQQSVAPHPICEAWVQQCQTSGQVCPPPPQCPVATPNGPALGTCVQTLCMGKTAPGMDGAQQGLDQGLGMLSQLLQQVMGALKGGGGGGGQPPPGGGAPPPPPMQTPIGGSSVLNPDGGSSTSGGIIDDLLDNIRNSSSTTGSLFGNLFGGGSDTDTTETEQATTTEDADQSLLDIITGGNATTSTETGTETAAGEDVSITTGDTASIDGVASERSEVRSSEDGVTFVAGVRDPENNSEVGGFYGVTNNNGDDASPGIVGRIVGGLCETRPWANNFLAQFLPVSFFDGLCTSRGYAVGQDVEVEPSDTEQGAVNTTELERAAQARAAGIEVESNEQGRGIACEPGAIREGERAELTFSCAPATLTGTAGFEVADASVGSALVSPAAETTYGILCSDGFQNSCTVRVVDPRVSIWAEPASVSLGARANIFWNTSDVENCRITGPSFSETGLYGGAATVPINGASTFTITCIAGDEIEVTEQVTVDLAL